MLELNIELNRNGSRTKPTTRGREGKSNKPIRMPPKGLSKDELSGPHLDLDNSQRSTIQERHERPSPIELSNCRKELTKLIIEFE